MGISERLGASANEIGMGLGGLTAGICIWEEMQRHGLVAYIVLGGLVTWGLYGAYSEIAMLKFNCERFERTLRAAGIDPSRSI
jgi:hypothetical protein